MKISIFGAGNVGSLTALRVAQENFAEVVLVDIVKGLAQGKSFDMEDARWLLNNNYNLRGTEDINQIKNSDIIVVTAGLARKPGMTREELLVKNAAILKDICLNIKNLSPNAIVIIVTNPLDLMTYYALKITGFSPKKLFGMGISLDAARFANIISKELNVPVVDIEACVIGSHGEAMLPVARFTKVKDKTLDKLVDSNKCADLIKRTISRGLEIVTLLGSGSAYFAPSAAITQIVKAIVKNESHIIGVCALLNGEYGLKDICLGLPCRIGKTGIEEIIKLDLNKEETEALNKSADSIRILLKQLPNP
ncbi:MAG: malate dehydrogenase [Candidatus Omnitrophota bacterium]